MGRARLFEVYKNEMADLSEHPNFFLWENVYNSIMIAYGICVIICLRGSAGDANA